MYLRGRLAELMVKVVPELYTKYVIINSKGETLLYIRFLNPLYGIVKAALLYYQHFHLTRRPALAVLPKSNWLICCQQLYANHSMD